MVDIIAPNNDPFALFDEWLKEAENTEINDANAMCVATVDKDGYPDTRIVLLKEFDPRGFTFFTNFESRKGQQILANKKASACFYWKSLGKQIRINGDIEVITDEEADRYYQSRARGSQIGAWASQQSRPLESRTVLEQRVEEITVKHENDEIVPRPPHWSGFRIIPKRIEFWMNGEFRLHDRYEFYKDEHDNWTSQRLYP